MENYLIELMNRTLKTKDDGESQYFENVLTFFSIALQMKSKKAYIQSDLGTEKYTLDVKFALWDEKSYVMPSIFS